MTTSPIRGGRLLAAACLLSLTAAAPARALDDSMTPTAEYAVVFNAVWSAQTHPTLFPPAPHFSALIGGTHDASVAFWETGGLATQGIETMAENGFPLTLANEISTAITLGSAGAVVQGIGTISPGSVATGFTATQEFSRITLVTMVAPSPDWFVGVSGLELFQNGAWVDQLTVPLLPYDAGTDSGIGFTSPNLDTHPADPITQLSGFPFNGGVPLGTFTFMRTDAPGPWRDLGSALPGAHGAPLLTGDGEPVDGGTVTLTLDDALEDSSATLVIGLSVLDAPVLGGTLVPTLDVLIMGLPIDAQGQLVLSGTWPAGVPAYTLVVTQLWISDPAGPFGWAASNGVCTLTD